MFSKVFLFLAVRPVATPSQRVIKKVTHVPQKKSNFCLLPMKPLGYPLLIASGTVRHNILQPSQTHSLSPNTLHPQTRRCPSSRKTRKNLHLLGYFPVHFAHTHSKGRSAIDISPPVVLSLSQMSGHAQAHTLEPAPPQIQNIYTHTAHTIRSHARAVCSCS